MVVPVVVVHWDEPERCQATVAALLGQTVPVRVLVVDNASTPERLAALRTGLSERNGSVEVVELRRNTGFGPAANVGFRRWLEDDQSDWIGLVPHDVDPDDDCLERMLAAAAVRPRAGLMSADVGDGASPVVDRYFGGILRPAAVEEGWEPVDHPHGTLLLAHRRCLDDVGLFDERYFAYCEEADLGCRARRAGWEVGLVRGAHVRNLHLSGPAPALDYLQERNTLLLVRQQFGRYAATIRLACSALSLIGGVVRPRRRPALFSVRARTTAIAHHLRGRYGPPPESLLGGSER